MCPSRSSLVHQGPYAITGSQRQDTVFSCVLHAGFKGQVLFFVQAKGPISEGVCQPSQLLEPVPYTNPTQNDMTVVTTHILQLIWQT